MAMLHVIQKGLIPYQVAWDFQKELHAKRLTGEIPDTLLLLEHTPVYTFGKNADHTHLLNPRDAEIIQSDRGGDITWHGPGQLVAYPIINLEDHRKSVSWYMRNLEEVVIQTLGKYDIIGDRIKGLTGVWVADKKICAMGVRLSRWTSMHGFALNVRPDMSYFSGMIPCGIQGKGVVSMQELLDKEIRVESVSAVVIKAFQEVFKYDNVIEF